MYKNGALMGSYKEQHAVALNSSKFKGGSLFLIREPGPGPSGGLNLSMRPELPGMICFQLLLLSKARGKKGSGRHATWRSVQVEDNLPGLRSHGAPTAML